MSLLFLLLSLLPAACSSPTDRAGRDLRARGEREDHKSRLATAHAQLVAAGVRDSGRAAASLRQVEAAYSSAVSARPRPTKALAEQLRQLQQAVRADLVRTVHVLYLAACALSCVREREGWGGRGEAEPASVPTGKPRAAG